MTGVDLARVALRAAKERARERGAGARQAGVVRRGGRRPVVGGDGRDPLPLGAALERLTAERGWELPLAVGGVMGRWPEIVGATNAEHWRPRHFDEESRTLTVLCDSTAWATQLRLLAPQVLARLNQDLGRDSVRLIRVTGPGSPGGSGGHGGNGRAGGGAGRWRAPGSRGPGDTYG
nr:DciA family protein [Streptomyces aidingensis]